MPKYSPIYCLLRRYDTLSLPHTYIFYTSRISHLCPLGFLVTHLLPKVYLDYIVNVSHRH